MSYVIQPIRAQIDFNPPITDVRIVYLLSNKEFYKKKNFMKNPENSMMISNLLVALIFFSPTYIVCVCVAIVS